VLAAVAAAGFFVLAKRNHIGASDLDRTGDRSSRPDQTGAVAAA
jgi:hypothetical protein